MKVNDIQMTYEELEFYCSILEDMILDIDDDFVPANFIPLREKAVLLVKIKKLQQIIDKFRDEVHKNE